MVDVKTEYYSDPHVTAAYDRKRFGRGGGHYVQQAESEAIAALLTSARLPAGGTALDCPTGTGRFIALLQGLGMQVWAADVSPAMLDIARQRGADRYLEASADALPLADSSVDAILMSRFIFHFEDPRPFLREAVRLLRPGGVLVFDAYRWTPRRWLPGSQGWLGGRTYVHRRAQVESWAKEIGLTLQRTLPLFLIAPYLYTFVPDPLTRRIERLSDRLAPAAKSKVYYLLRKPAEPEP